MARPVRVDVKGGWYHITARGTERRTLFGSTRECSHFLDLLEEMSERYRVEVHAYALMGNHYHLLIRTPGANASAAIQWLNVSYSVWFNRRRQRVGHVFQGRFGSVLIEGEGAWALNASIYIHLNPLHITQMGLDKGSHRAEARGFEVPNPPQIKARLNALRQARWTSYRAYAGYEAAPEWLHTEELIRRAGGRARYRRQVQTHVTRGSPPEGFEDLRGRVILGTRQFAQQARQWVGRLTKEQPARRQVAGAVSLAAIVRAVERERGEAWAQFAHRYGDWGRDLALYLARQCSGLTLRQIGQGLDGVEYKAVAKAVQRFTLALARDTQKRRAVSNCMEQLSNVET